MNEVNVCTLQSMNNSSELLDNAPGRRKKFILDTNIEDGARAMIFINVFNLSDLRFTMTLSGRVSERVK